MLEKNYWTLKQIKKDLNESINATELDIRKFVRVCSYLMKAYKSPIKLVDLKKHTEKYAKQMRMEKQTAIACHDFVLAAECRDEERLCEYYLSCKVKWMISETTFIHESNEFYYCYRGTSRNDDKLLAIMKVNKWIEPLTRPNSLK